MGSWIAEGYSKLDFAATAGSIPSHWKVCRVTTKEVEVEQSKRSKLIDKKTTKRVKVEEIKREKKITKKAKTLKAILMRELKVSLGHIR